jgi:hypothetical protein
VWVFETFLPTSLDIQQFILKLAMKSNALDGMVKPINAKYISHLWCIRLTSKVIFYFVKKIQVGSDCHGTSFWECGG